MATSSDSSHETTTPDGREQHIGTTRLWELDLPVLLKTSSPFPEQTEGNTFHSVLDVACGRGAWVVAFAQAYPNAQVVGVDSNAQHLEEARAQAKAQGIRNATFFHMDSLYPLDFADQTFDLVNLRFLAGILALRLYPLVIQDCLRVTHRGGILRVTEGDIPITNSSAFEQLSGWLSRSLCDYHIFPTGTNFMITPILRRWLQQAGCMDIKSEAFVTNFSTGMEAHAVLVPSFAATYQRMQPMLAQTGGIPQEEVARTRAQMLTESAEERFCAVAFYLTVWGRKP